VVLTPSHFTKGTPDALVPDLQSPLALVQETAWLYGPQSVVTVQEDFQSAPSGAAPGETESPSGAKIALRNASTEGRCGAAAALSAGRARAKTAIPKAAFLMMTSLS